MRDLGFEPVDTGEFYFLSYNSQDANRIAPLFKALSDSGVPIWYDKGINYNASQWSKEIADHIQNCKAVLFSQTKGLIQRENSYAKREYTVAKNLGKEIFVLAFDKVDIKSAPTENMFFVEELNSKQQIPITGNHGRDAEEICRILNLKYQNQKDHTKDRKIPLHAIAAAITLAILALILIPKPIPPFPPAPASGPTAAPMEEPTPIPATPTPAPTATPEPWTCLICGKQNSSMNDACWNCIEKRGTTPVPTATPEPTSDAASIDQYEPGSELPEGWVWVGYICKAKVSVRSESKPDKTPEDKQLAKGAPVQITGTFFNEKGTKIQDFFRVNTVKFGDGIIPKTYIDNISAVTEEELKEIRRSISETPFTGSSDGGGGSAADGELFD